MKNVGINTVTTIDLVELSDAFRRGAAFSKPKTVEKLVKLTRDFNASLSYHYPDLPTTHEMNVRSAIEGILDKDSVRDYSVALQGPLTPGLKLRVMAEAARRIEQAERTYDLAPSTAVSHIF